MDFSKLPYNKLQQACKERGLNAKGKVTELIIRLNDYESNKALEQPINDDNVNNDKTHTNDIAPNSNSFTDSCMDMMSSMLGVSNDNTVSNSNTQPVEIKKISPLDAIPTGKTEVRKIEVETTVSKVNTSISKQPKFTSIRPVVDFDQDSAFTNVGYFSIDTNSLVTGESALHILKYLWRMFPVISNNIDVYTPDNRLHIKFDELREIQVAKKVLKQGRNLIPSVVEYGDPRNRKVQVASDRGTIPGTNLPSETRQGFKTGIKGHIIDHKKPTIIKSGNTTLLDLENTKVTVLKSQAYNAITGKSRDHKDTCGYLGKTHNAKTKMSTGVRLSSSVQKMIDTRLLSNIFQLPQYQYGLQLQITEQGNIVLNEYQPSGRRTIATIAHITGIHYQQHANKNIRIFDWAYYDSFKNRSKKLDKQIKTHLNRCNIDVCVFLSQYTTFEIKEDSGDIGKMSKNKRKQLVSNVKFR